LGIVLFLTKQNKIEYKNEYYTNFTVMSVNVPANAINCVICGKIKSNVYIAVECNHLICHTCYTTETDKCLYCHKETEYKDGSIILSFLKNFVIYNCAYGCNVYDKSYSEISDHYETCDKFKSMVLCSWCNDSVQKDEIDKHAKKCNYKPVKCKACDSYLFDYEFVMHICGDGYSNRVAQSFYREIGF